MKTEASDSESDSNSRQVMRRPRGGLEGLTGECSLFVHERDALGEREEKEKVNGLRHERTIPVRLVPLGVAAFDVPALWAFK